VRLVGAPLQPPGSHGGHSAQAALVAHMAPTARSGAGACPSAPPSSTLRARPGARTGLQLLDPRYCMAAEFRARAWVLGAEGDATAAWLAEHRLVLVASDDLRHEMAQPDRRAGTQCGGFRVEG